MSETREKERTAAFDAELHGRFWEIVGEGKRISQAKAAIALGYSGGVISAYKSRTYNGDVKGLERKIAAWMKREERRLGRLEVPVAETAALARIRRAVTVAQDEADIAVITGDAGTGKTTALRQYAEESRSAILIEVDPSFTKTTLMKAIARALGADMRGGQTAVVERVVEALSGRDAVLIVDEADYLSAASLELLRRVVNDKSGTGVVLVGLPRLEYNIRNLKNDHQQLQSRIGVTARLGAMDRTDAAKIVSGVWGEVSRPVLDAFTRTAGGSVRTLVKLMGRVHQSMAINGDSAPSEEIIADAGTLLMR